MIIPIQAEWYEWDGMYYVFYGNGYVSVQFEPCENVKKNKNTGNRLPPLLNGDSEKKLFCD